MAGWRRAWVSHASEPGQPRGALPWRWAAPRTCFVDGRVHSGALPCCGPLVLAVWWLWGGQVSHLGFLRVRRYTAFASVKQPMSADDAAGAEPAGEEDDIVNR